MTPSDVAPSVKNLVKAQILEQEPICLRARGRARARARA